MKIIVISVLLIIFSCFGIEFPQNEKVQEHSFKDYINTFSTKNLPLKFDRKDVFDLSKLVFDSVTLKYKSVYPEVKEIYKNFVPKDILKNRSTKNFRCLFVLPEINKVIPVIIGEDFFRFGEQNMLKLFLITYNKKGQVLDFIQMAGYSIDEFVELADVQGEQIKTWNYQYEQEPPSNNDPYLFYFLETRKTYKINSTGHIIKIGEFSRKGYFKENGWEGYIFVK